MSAHWYLPCVAVLLAAACGGAGSPDSAAHEPGTLTLTDTFRVAPGDADLTRVGFMAISPDGDISGNRSMLVAAQHLAALRQTRRAISAASPRYAAGVRAFKRARSAAGSGSLSMKPASPAASTSVPRVKSLSSS